MRSRTERAQKGRHSRRRAEPDRPGDRVRLLLRPCRLQPVRGRHRDGHDQLQSGNRLDRLRYLGPPLFRAADRRGRDRGRARGTAPRHADGRHRAVRRADAVETGGGAGTGQDPDSRNLARCHRSRRRPAALPGAAAAARPAAAGERHRLLDRGGRGGGARDRLSGGDPSLLRAGRAGDDDRARCRRAQGLHAASGHRLLIDRYLQNAIEVDVDAVCDGEAVAVAGIMEHIEEAGIHSGDSACSLPPYSLAAATVAEIERQTEALARALGVVGLMNAQFAVKDGEVYVLEVNPRASRTVPFVAKATGVPIAKIAARVMAGARLDAGAAGRWGRRLGHVAVKEAVFPFARFPGVDLILGPEMKSTGEVMGLDRDFGRAFAKSQLGSGNTLPREGWVFVSVRDQDKEALIEPCRRLVEMGFALVATRGTAARLAAAGLPVSTVNKVREGRPHIVDRMLDGGVQLVFNTTEGAQAIADSFSLRRTALTLGIPYYTTVAGARAAVQAIAALKAGSLEVAPLQSYF